MSSLSWAPADAIGALAGGGVSDQFGQTAGYLALGALCIAMLATITPRRIAVTG